MVKGEGTTEELLASEEATKPTPHPKLRIAQAREVNRDLVGQMVTWCESDRAADDAEVRARLKAWIPEYMPPAGVPVSVVLVLTHTAVAPAAVGIGTVVTIMVLVAIQPPDMV